jgi:hypothetical protein
MRGPEDVEEGAGADPMLTLKLRGQQILWVIASVRKNHRLLQVSERITKKTVRCAREATEMRAYRKLILLRPSRRF